MASSSTPIIIEDKPGETSTVTTQESQNIKKKECGKIKNSFSTRSNEGTGS